ncbi:MAG: hypothetical protein ABIJ45_12870 [Candidatus Zixiibacteriota bacterium]
MDNDLYGYIPKLPEKVNGANVLVRVIDGAANRFKWSMEGLDESMSNFRPVEGSMNLGELVNHIFILAAWLYKSFVDRSFSEEPTGGIHDKKMRTLEILYKIREHLLDMDDSELAKITIAHNWSDEKIPFWLLINGPIADILTHVGQICSWRRMAGNPIPRANLFRGIPPKEVS